MKFPSRPQNRVRWLTTRAWLLGCGFCSLPLTPLAAQEAAVADEQELREVTVTARHGAEKAKDVPFALSVIQGQELEEKRMRSLEEAMRDVPGVDIGSWGGDNDANVRIRGVGSLYQVNADDGSVVLNIDGVSMSARHLSLGSFDIERVEVLKGPQGTLFGRNSEAGAINITTRRPTRHMEGYIRGEYGQDGQHLEEFALGGPLSKQWSARFALRRNGANNVVEDASSGNPVTKPTDFAWRGSLLWDIAPGTSALWISERQTMNGHVQLMVPRPYEETPRLDFGDIDMDSDKQVQRHSLEIKHNFSRAQLTSVTAWLESDLRLMSGSDRSVSYMWMGMDAPLLKNAYGDERVFSQDLRLSSLPQDKIFWVGGVNFLSSKRGFDSEIPAYLTYNRHDFKTDSQAIYGEVTYPLTDALKLTGGLRYTHEKKEFDGDYLTGAARVTDSRQLSDNYTTGRLALSYAVSPATTIYGVVARGYKSGGFNDYAQSVSDGEPYKAAVSQSVEMGFKHESSDQRFALNGAVFFNKVRDDHLLGYDQKTFSTKAVNVDTRSKGVELEGHWRIGGGFTLTGGVAWLDGKITSDAIGVDGGDVHSGNKVPEVPKLSYNLSLQYQQALETSLFGVSSPILNARVSWRSVGKRSADPQNHFDLDSYNKVDFRVGVAAGSAEFYVWGDNLLDEQYDLYGYQMQSYVTGLPFAVGMPSRGRSFGVGAALYF